MYWGIGLALAGFIAGAGVMYGRQRKYREQELQSLARMTEMILNEQKLELSASGEETLYARIENQLVRVQEMLQGRSEAALRSRDEIQKLISEIAHQMRTPLMNAKTYLELLQDAMAEAAVPEELRSDTEAVEESTEKLHFLVENFVKMSRLEHHIIQIRKEDGDILRTVRNALGQIQSAAQDKGITFAVTFPERAVCMHDSNWLGEALYNLLDNAVKYSKGHTAMRVPDGAGFSPQIEVSVAVNEMFLKIRIRDYGIGIEAGEENEIFRRFYRGKRVTTQEGYGIGLYLAREIVNLHGGFLTARRMSKGLVMEMNLPFVC